MSKQNTGNRLVVLDTETTGLDPKAGHRIIEIGCVEIRERRLTGNNFHEYLQPKREIDAGAMEVHGITNEFLVDKPVFADIQQAFLDYVDGAQLIIHNAPFDVAFLEHEFTLNGYNQLLSVHCDVVDSLKLARSMFPGQRNSLDALCKRMDINNSHRILHGALLDSEILADVYLRMTGGQTTLELDASATPATTAKPSSRLARTDEELLVVMATEQELSAHRTWISRLEAESEVGCRWP